MSVQFGRWNFAGQPAAPNYMKKIEALLLPFGPDEGSSFAERGVQILYRAFNTTKECHNEVQPHVTASGIVLTWDGRLDNRADLIAELRGVLPDEPSDSAIVGSAYGFWGNRSLSRFVGDWALSIWNPNSRVLTLARDFVGTRLLFYTFDQTQVTWSSVLDPLLLGAGPFDIDEEYIAGWLSFFPAPHVTPFKQIRSVPPSCLISLEPRRCTIEKYWDFDSGKTIRYQSDAEYEEHFRHAFAQSVERRLRADAPVLAELSGGMDSSSIVCMADAIQARGDADTSRIDTISYYNDSEPDWNERPYFTKVEEMRGRAGFHIAVGTKDGAETADDSLTFRTTPTASIARTEASQQFAACLAAQGNRVLLSGIGGDEVMGGVPSPAPELMDLLMGMHLRRLAANLKLWALDKKKPWFHLLFETIRGFLPVSVVGLPKYMRPMAWLDPGFLVRQRVALTGYPSRIRAFGPLPSFQENLFTLDGLRRQITCSSPSPWPLYEKRYPYLDRTLLEFLYSIPREQLVRPGQRRSLMRRALIGIVPPEILNRRRKAYAIKSGTAKILSQWNSLSAEGKPLMSQAFGFIDANAFAREIERARCGQDIHVVAIDRVLLLESWLRNIQGHRNAESRYTAINYGSLSFESQVMPLGSLVHKSSAS